jgi:aspartyl-tRNA(Asn)/glutamyl-tRNA(Gln) amidotransferase subunit C
MSVDKETVAKIARLARVRVEEGQKEALARELSNILGWIEQLSELDTEGVEPTAHVSNVAAALREDRLEAGVEHEVALAEAPRAAAGGFAVPAFVEES